MTPKPKDVLAAIDAALDQRKSVRLYEPLSASLITEACAKLKIGPTPAEVAELDALDKPRLAALNFALRHSDLKAIKDTWLGEHRTAGKRLSAGESVTARTRAQVTEDFKANRQAGMRAATPHSESQVAIVRAITLRVCDQIEAAATDLGNFHTNALAKLLVDNPEDIGKVFKDQVKTLRSFATKLRANAYFNWQNTLADFGIPSQPVK
jgi:hypothetical protein